MNFKERKKLASAIERVHLYTFGHEMSDEMRKFLNNLSWSFFGGMTASIILFVVAVGAARLLGPSEFGKYSLIIAVAEVLLVVIIFGVDIGSIKLLSASSAKKNRNKTISSSFVLFGIVSVLVCLISFLGFGLVERFTNFDTMTILLTVVVALAFGFKRIGDSYMRGLMLFKDQARYKIIEAISVICLFIITFFIIGISNYLAYIAIIIFGVGIAGILYLKEYIKYLSKNDISKKYSKKILSYSAFGIIASVTSIVVQSFDKLFIYKYFELSDVGVYSVYYMLSLLLSSQIIQIVINVFFPSMNEQVKKDDIFQKINKLAKVGFLPGVIFFVVFIRVALFFFGSEYEVFWSWIMILSFFSVIHFYTALYGWTLISISREGYKKQNIGLIMGILGYILTIVVGIWILGLTIEILFIALVVNRLISGLAYKVFIKKLI